MGVPGRKALVSTSSLGHLEKLRFVFVLPRGLFEWSVQAFQKLLAWLSCVVEYEFTVAELGVQSFEFVEALVAEYTGTLPYRSY